MVKAVTSGGHCAETQELWAALRPEIIAHYEALWRRPELPMMEVAAAQAQCDWLAGHGFEVERGVCGIPTAFRAIYGRGEGPSIGLLAEYDALPGQGNAVVPHRRGDGRAAGHACGHNQIGPSSIGAAIAARQVMERQGLSGRIVVLGTPAEEIIWGKIAMLDRGGFTGIDALLACHVDYQNGAVSRPCQSGLGGEFLIRGVAGHAGRVRRQNALDTVELAVQTWERLRAHHFPDVSVEHVLRNGGLMPNITPDEARLWVFLRHADYERAAEIYDYVRDLIGQAAATTGTEFHELFIAGSRGYLANDTLAEVLQGNLDIVGPPQWDADELAFMAELAEACQPGEAMALARKTALHKDGTDPYGQDDGEASWRIPLTRANWAIPAQIPLHSWAASALTGHSASRRGALMASEGLALTVVELLARPDLVEAAKAELRHRVGGRCLSPPRYGGFRLLTETPERFWDGAWTADDVTA